MHLASRRSVRTPLSSSTTIIASFSHMRVSAPTAPPLLSLPMSVQRLDAEQEAGGPSPQEAKYMALGRATLTEAQSAMCTDLEALMIVRGFETYKKSVAVIFFGCLVAIQWLVDGIAAHTKSSYHTDANPTHARTHARTTRT